MPRAKTAFTGTFDDALKSFLKHTNSSMEMARICAEMGLEHFVKHGDLSYCQRFYDTMPKNYTRRAAYVSWLTSFAPVILEEQKFLKDTRAEAMKVDQVDIGAASETPFWEFAPETPIVTFTAEEFDKRVLGLIKRYLTSEKLKAADETVLDHIRNIEEHIVPLLTPAIAAEHGAQAAASPAHPIH